MPHWRRSVPRSSRRRPRPQGTKPTDAERQAREKARVTALAKELGVSEAKVQAALDAIKADREASRKSRAVHPPRRRGQGRHPDRAPTRPRSSRRSTPASWVAGARRPDRPDRPRPHRVPPVGAAGASAAPGGRRVTSAPAPASGWRPRGIPRTWWTVRDAPSVRVCRVARPRFGRSPPALAHWTGCLTRAVDPCRRRHPR